MKKPIFEIYDTTNDKVEWVITNDINFKKHLEELNYEIKTTTQTPFGLYDIYFDNLKLTIKEFNKVLLKYLAKRS